MHIHILGICGTFMGGIALLARASGHRVTGCDANVYPPMSTQLEAQGIELIDSYEAAQVGLKPDLFVVGNAISRGNPLLEAILDHGLPYVSGPQWLAENVLRDKWVLAVAGTHGKTTTSSLLAWILEQGGLQPGFLIGGVPQDFGVSARLTTSPFFVIEADEYDTAFCDKRSKFVHYRARTAILNNLEFDHADIFGDLAAIETQFHHFVRILPKSGLIVANAAEASLKRVLARGCWTPVEWFGASEGWQLGSETPDGSCRVDFVGEEVGRLSLPLAGEHNRANALAALENVALWHERDISHSGAERVILPDATIALDYMLHLATRMASGMVVHSDRMRENIDLTYGALFSQRVLLALVTAGRSRDDAYRLIQQYAQRAWDTRTPLRSLLAEAPEAAELDLEQIFDLGHYARHASAIVGRLDSLDR